MHAEKWQKDLAVYRDINTTFIIEGNVHDLQMWVYEDDGMCEPLNLAQYLHRYLSEVGYDPIVFYNRVDGFGNPYDPEMLASFFRSVSSDENTSRSLCAATDCIRKAMSGTIRPTAIVIDLANTIAPSPDNLSDEEIEHYAKLMLASKTAEQALSTRNRQALTNLLFLIVEKVNDVPAWFYLNNPYVRTLTISRPEKEAREAIVSARLDSLAGASSLSAAERKDAEAALVSLTAGMTLVELFGIFSLCRKKQYSVRQIRDAVKMFRYGETESHWDKIDLDRMKNAKEFLSRRVKGQERAVNKVASVLRRSCSGMSNIQGGSSSRPKGVLFFAGPTGTGKTELAKTVAELIFGDDGFVTRFDMSEYRQPHSDQKLLGAPPGYVGYNDGGQLTNAIKAKPFCVLLFDEIDKADPSILDKFLQVLDDGRITDSAGETMYFSETLIIFTSNLGVVKTDAENHQRFQTVTPDMSYEEIQARLLAVIKDYFKYSMQRPELLNRIGDNFVVFDFIREDAASQILTLKLSVIEENFEREKGVRLSVGDEYRAYLLGKATADLSNGGRGIGNMIETELINPLSDVLFTEEWDAGCAIEIVSPREDGDGIPFHYAISRN